MSESNSSKKVVYYIKDNIIFSSKTTKFALPTQFDDIKIPTDTKNHLTNNKILFTDLEKLAQKQTKEFEFTHIIDNFDEISKDITKKYKENKDLFAKPREDDYNFIEKTSQIQILDGIISNISTQDIETLQNNIKLYIEHNKYIEKEKNASIDEQIEIESNKIRSIEEEMEEFRAKNIKPLENKIKEKRNKISILNEERVKLDTKLSKSSQSSDLVTQKEKIENKIENIKHKIKNYEMEIKILKSRISSLQTDIKLGRKKCINIFLFIITLGLIYWTRFSDCKYHVLRLKRKVNRTEEKILVLEKKKYNLEQDLEEKIKKTNKTSIKDVQSMQDTASRIAEIDVKIEKENSEIKVQERQIQQKEKELNKFESHINKIESKIVDLTSLKEEFEKYSTNKISEKLNHVINSKRAKIQELKNLREKLKGQKTSIDGEWICTM